MTLPILKKGVFIFSLLLISVNISAQTPAPVIPEFKFFKLDKTAFTNKNLEAKKLLFFVFFDVTCDHCRHAIGKINEHLGEFNKTAVYLITLDNQDGIKNFMSHYGQNLPGNKNVTILQDLQNEFINKFRPVKYPSMFLYSRDKKLILYDDNPDNFVKFLNRIKSAAK